jgi:hypothetical protein
LLSASQSASGVFFAKHSEHAALWLLGPTFFICWIMPASKLQSMLLAAMAIELVWLFRQYSGQRKKEIYPLTPSDRSVLNAHARGDLKAFRRHNGISELVLSEKVVNWKGCSKNTPPCPFNLYVNRLGLNTAPCCREHMHDISHYVSDCLLKLGSYIGLKEGVS